jgi:hypothetical protein
VTIRKQYLVLLLIFVVLGIYYPSIFAEFNSVDDVKMVNQIENRPSVDLDRLFFRKGGSYYRPLLSLTFIADKYVWGLQPSFMHLENILLHAFNAVMVFLIAGRILALLGFASPIFSFYASLLFALHPINTEAVNWVSGRTDILAGSFLFASMYLLLRFLENRDRAIVALGILCFFLACLCKDSAVFAYPGFLVLMVAIARHPKVGESSDWKTARLGQLLLPAVGYSLATGGYFVLRHIALAGRDSGVKGAVAGLVGKETHVQQKLWLMMKAFGFYIKKLFVPWPLSFAITHVSDLYYIVGVLGILLAIYLLWRRGIPGALFLFSACIIAPALLVPVSGFAWTPLAERYLYMAVPTFCIAGVYGVLRIRSMRPIRFLPALAGCLLLPGLAWSVYERNMTWQSNLALFEDCVRKNPDFMPAKNDLALAKRNAGMHAEANSMFIANSLPPSIKYSIITNLNKASAMAASGKTREARKMLKEAAYTKKNRYFSKFLEYQIFLNDKLLADKELDSAERILLQREVIDYLSQLQSVTGNSVHFYTLGQRFLSLGEKHKAHQYFNLAYERSSPTAYYHEAAKKLSEKLKQ